MRNAFTLVGLLLVTGLPAPARGAPIESSQSIPVRVAPAGPVIGAVPVLVVRPDDHRRHPVLLIVHGRGVDAAENARMGRVDYPANARYFAERGYAVLIPTRLGYGYAGGGDREETGPCNHKDPRSALHFAASEMTQVLAAIRAEAWADADRSIVIGDSFGGLIALTMATDPTPGLRGVVAFSAGDGGDSLRHVDSPCDAAAQADLWAELGKANRRPALVLYSANDRTFGTAWPKRWFERWQQAGGQGEWVSLPADKNNGHYIFMRNPPAWQAPLAQFFTRVGLP